MLYPIVTVEREELHGTVFVSWFRNRYEQNAGKPGLAAHEEGVYVAGGWVADLTEFHDFQTALQEAWDAVRAIRHGTSLERFPRDLTTVSEATEDVQ